MFEDFQEKYDQINLVTNTTQLIWIMSYKNHDFISYILCTNGVFPKWTLKNWPSHFGDLLIVGDDLCNSQIPLQKFFSKLKPVIEKSLNLKTGRTVIFKSIKYQNITEDLPALPRTYIKVTTYFNLSFLNIKIAWCR